MSVRDHVRYDFVIDEAVKGQGVKSGPQQAMNRENLQSRALHLLGVMLVAAFK
jgi:hypothetical protein